jgi:hypothetical protein
MKKVFSEMQRKTIDGVHFLRLRGSRTERARKHAFLLRPEMSRGALLELSKKNEWLIRRGPGIMQTALVSGSIVWLYRNILLKWLEQRAPSEQREVMKALAEESGLPYSKILEALYQPDGLMLLSRLSVMKYFLKEMPISSGLPGCSSVVLGPSWSRENQILIARNMDYPIVGPWEKNTTVLFHEPDSSHEIPHVAITTAGVHTSGLTAMNQEGLTLSTHAHFGKEVSLMGRPIFMLGEDVISRSRSLDEAVDLCRKIKRVGNWTFVMASAKENTAIAIEMTPEKTHVRGMKDELIAHTNFFHTSDLQEKEALISGACREDIFCRLERMKEILAPLKGQVNVADLGRVLGDHTDFETKQERIYGSTLSVVTTVKSVLFNPEKQELWISSRGESPTGLGNFLGVSVESFWQKGSFEPRRMNPCGEIERDEEYTNHFLPALQEYRKAYQAWHSDNHLEDHAQRTLISLRKAVRLYGKDGNVWIQAGLVAFKQNEFQEAKSYFTETLDKSLSCHTVHVRDLFLARCHDVLKEREEALMIYRQYAEVGEPRLRKAFKKGLKRPYRGEQTTELLLDLQFPDVHQY